jgi:hypothetical protein
MSLYVPEVAEAHMLQKILNQTLKLKLFSNNHTPAAGDTVSSLTEVTGGGYAAISLTYAEWTIGGGDPAVALYSDFQEFLFTGATSGPGTIYGYYVTTSDDLTLLWEERFAAEDVPFSPIADSLIRVKPRFTLNDATD